VLPVRDDGHAEQPVTLTGTGSGGSGPRPDGAVFQLKTLKGSEPDAW
jgi:hypothetical protein